MILSKTLQTLPTLTDQHLALAAAATGAAMLVALLFSRRALAGTTLTSSWNWSLLAVVALIGCELAAAVYGAGAVYRPAWLAPLRFIAFTSTFCPMMALFGARRPQNREWKYIVWCLWIVLALPAGWALLLHPGRFSLEPLWAFFLLALIAASTCNFLLTRYWLSSVLYGAGQVLLVANYLPWFAGDTAHAEPTSGTLAAVTVTPLAGQLFLAAALALAHLVAAWRRCPPSPGRHPLDRLWIDFRDSFGAVWALRVAQRTNAAATMYNWNMQLRWDGFHTTGPEGGAAPHEAAPLPNDTLPTDTARAVERHLRSLLRRFVSPDWIDQRLTGP